MLSPFELNKEPVKLEKAKELILSTLMGKENLVLTILFLFLTPG